MLVTKVSMFSGVSHTLDIPVTQEQLDSWLGGKLIQVAMPNLSPDDREFLITGMTPDEWEEMMGDDDDH